MRILTFQARHFRWKAFSQTLEDADQGGLLGSLEDVVVTWLHAETKDEDEGSRPRVFRHTLKHLKWMANKRGLTRIALHSFTHLGADNATPAFARRFIDDLATRLQETGYEVGKTPFGWFCEWELSVFGESQAKVWKEI
jgi:threonyl-tRNA synthetase